MLLGFSFSLSAFWGKTVELSGIEVLLPGIFDCLLDLYVHSGVHRTFSKNRIISETIKWQKFFVPGPARMSIISSSAIAKLQLQNTCRPKRSPSKHFSQNAHSRATRLPIYRLASRFMREPTAYNYIEPIGILNLWVMISLKTSRRKGWPLTKSWPPACQP